jgi:hypothetical protein
MLEVAMIYQTILCCGFVCALVTGSAAQAPGGRVDLDVVSGSSSPRFVVGSVAFAEGDSSCPEEHGTLRIFKGVLTQLRMRIANDPQSTSKGRATKKPTDDETQQYRIEGPTCRMDINVREQVRHDGTWTSLLVPRVERPSIPLAERSEIQRQFLENLRTPKEPKEQTQLQELIERRRAAEKELRAMGNLRVNVGSLSWPFAYENTPQVCFEAVGDYRIDRTGFTFSFLTGLPGDLNRFVIERTDLDANRSRLYFMREDCRFELTVSQSVLRDGRWIPLALAPIPPPIPVVPY